MEREMIDKKNKIRNTEENDVSSSYRFGAN